jgi:hypothetical protein
MKTIIYIFFANIFFISIITEQCYSFELDSNDRYISILKVAHFNDDATKDTLIAFADYNASSISIQSVNIL